MTTRPWVNIVDLEVEPKDISHPDEYQQFCDRFSFKLDNFQKYAIAGLLAGDNTLVTVPTSCGKTVVAEFAIWWCLQHQKRVIYTSPIKTLSNQKFSEFQEKFDHSQIGIVTGDVKFNPDAPCLIMTTEILRDLLFKGSPQLEQVGMVIFDEVHYINNDDRGYVWEQCLMLLNPAIQLIMLSATISRPELFANWIGNIKQKTVHLIVHQNRPVPLVNYLFSPFPNNRIEPYFADRRFNIDTYSQYYKKFQLEGKSKRSETSLINNLVQYLKQQDLCPALLFTFSRQKCEQLANCIVENFHTTQEQTEIERTINSLLSKYQYDYHSLKQIPQVIKLTELAKKGIAFHHSGLLPFSKEIIEILFSRGLIKIMFVTETFSVGINMPTRTVVFTDLSKNVNGKFRYLYTDEFYQMAGRAGRRGLDTKGCVIYFPIQRMLTTSEIRSMLEGQPMSIKSRYQVDYHIILQQLNFGQPYQIVERSYLFQELDRFVLQTSQELEKLQTELKILQEQSNYLKVDMTPKQIELLEQLYQLDSGEQTVEQQELLGNKFNFKLDNKQQKQVKAKREHIRSQFRINQMTDGNNRLLSNFDQYFKLLPNCQNLEREIDKYQATIENPDWHLKNKYQTTIDSLVKGGLLTSEHTLTPHGKIAALINNADALLLVQTLQNGILNEHDTITTGLLLSLLTANLSGKHQLSIDEVTLFADDLPLKRSIRQIIQMGINLIDTYPVYQEPELPVDLLEPTYYWLKGRPFVEIAPQLEHLQGDFIRSLLRLLRLCEELVEAVNSVGMYLPLELKLRELVGLINRDIIIFDSIYIKGFAL